MQDASKMFHNRICFWGSMGLLMNTGGFAVFRWGLMEALLKTPGKMIGIAEAISAADLANR